MKQGRKLYFKVGVADHVFMNGQHFKTLEEADRHWINSTGAGPAHFFVYDEDLNLLYVMPEGERWVEWLRTRRPGANTTTYYYETVEKEIRELLDP